VKIVTTGKIAMDKNGHQYLRGRKASNGKKQRTEEVDVVHRGNRPSRHLAWGKPPNINVNVLTGGL